MAKIENETRLILKLASDRMDTWLARWTPDNQTGQSEQSGEKRAIKAYKLCLDDIAAELEQR